jgi:hypothetical protein
MRKDTAHRTRRQSTLQRADANEEEVHSHGNEQSRRRDRSTAQDLRRRQTSNGQAMPTRVRHRARSPRDEEAQMQPGEKVRVTSAAAGTDICEVVHVTPPAIMPVIPGAPDPREVAAILEEEGIDLVILLTHRLETPRPLQFFAFRQKRTGHWYDLQKQRLTIESV